MPSHQRPAKEIVIPIKAQREDDACPDYEVAVSRSNSNATGSTSVHWLSPTDDVGTSSLKSGSSLRRPPRSPAVPPERYLYTYRLVAGTTPIEVQISVEPAYSRTISGKYIFRLSYVSNGIGRTLCQPLPLNLKVDPRKLEFIVFIFPGKSSLPTGCLWCLRVWLRVNGIDHRLFGDDDLWVGRDPDFNSIGDASFTRLIGVDAKEQLYHAYVGKALVSFTIRWRRVDGVHYKYSLEYEAGGVGGFLFEDLELRVEGDPRTVTFLMYSVPTSSIPVGAAHRLRVWIRSYIPLSTIDPAASYVVPFNDSYIYHRVWKLDGFKIGSKLDFESLGTKLVMGFSTGAPETIILAQPPKPDKLRTPKLTQEKSYDKIKMDHNM